MKKIIGLIFLALIVVGGIAGYKYYADTYKSTVAYAQVPATVPEEVQTKDMNGKDVDGLHSYHYDFTFVKEDGEIQKESYDVTGENPTPLEPNTYVKVELSKKRVTKGPTTVSETSIPKDLLQKLGA
ncbi:DUF1093 domain-containing protein [Enterococcus sp. LJL99]